MGARDPLLDEVIVEGVYSVLSAQVVQGLLFVVVEPLPERRITCISSSQLASRGVNCAVCAVQRDSVFHLVDSSRP